MPLSTAKRILHDVSIPAPRAPRGPDTSRGPSRRSDSAPLSSRTSSPGTTGTPTRIRRAARRESRARHLRDPLEREPLIAAGTGDAVLESDDSGIVVRTVRATGEELVQGLFTPQ